MKTILLVRHGQASFGSDNYDKLSDLGEQQAKLLGQYFAKQHKQVEQVFAGTLQRQQQSANHFLDEFMTNGQPFPIDTIDKFNEFNHQQILLKSTGFESLTALKMSLVKEANPKCKLAELFKTAMIRWHSANHVSMVDGDYDECWEQFANRCFQGLEQVIEQTEDEQTSMVFTSGGVIASIVSTLMSLPDICQSSQTAFSINRQLVNTGMTSIVVSDASNIGKEGLPTLKKQLITLNACEHLQLAGSDYLTWY